MKSKHTVRIFALVIGVLLFLFFTNDFGLTDVQKTAIVMAVGIDREEDTFVVTSQIAVPSSGDGQSKPVQIESRGATVAEAVSRINGKSGWYPKLVFCKLVVIGEEAAKKNVFDALDYFLRDEYLSDGCFVAVADGTAKRILDAKTPIDTSSALAVQKVLSEHAERVGTVAPATLRDFAKGYFGDAKSGWTPVVKVEPKEESGEDKSVPSAQGGGQGGQGGGQSGKSGEAQSGNEEFTFSAAETALFAKGLMVGKLTPEETFAFQTATGKLRLASYTVESEGASRSLLIKNNQPSVELTVDKKSVPRLKISVTLTVAVEDTAKSETLENITDIGAIPDPLRKAAEKTLEETLLRVFEKSRACGCDLFDAVGSLKKKETKYFAAYREDLLERIVPSVSVKIKSVR